jgi:hypothetical protein
MIETLPLLVFPNPSNQIDGENHVERADQLGNGNPGRTR